MLGILLRLACVTKSKGDLSDAQWKNLYLDDRLRTAFARSSGLLLLTYARLFIVLVAARFSEHTSLLT